MTAAMLFTACPEERVFDTYPYAIAPNDMDQAGMGGSAGESTTEGDSLNPGESSTSEGLTVVPSSLSLGSITQGFAARGRLTVRNTSEEPLALPAAAWSAESHPDLTLVQNQCFGELAPGEACELRVQVVPSAAGELLGTLEVSSAPAGTVVVPVSAYGLEPGDILMLPAAGSFEDFGGVRVGESAEGTFTVTNPGSASTGPLSFHFNRPEFTLLEPTANECAEGSTSLASGESCDVRVEFRPTERGAVEAVASVSSSGAGSMSLSLRGRGQVPGVLTASVSMLDFGGVVPGSAAAQEVAIENQGDDPLTLGAVTLEPADVGVFAIASSNCGDGAVLGADQSCAVQVEYRPVQEAIVSLATLVVQTAGGEQSQRIALQGRGLTRGNLVVAAAAAGGDDFGEVLLGQTAERQFRIENPEEQPSGVLTLSASQGFELVEGSGDGACISGTTELASGQSCEVTVRFAPERRGAVTGALTVDSTLAGAASLPLTGVGLAPARLLATTSTAGETTVDFGRVTTDSQAQRTVTVRNGGDQPLPPPAVEVTSTGGSTAAAQAAAFGYESTCSSALGFDEACTLTLTFEPAAAGPHSATLELSSEPGGRSSILLVGEAREPGRLVLAVAAGSSADFGDVAVGESSPQSFVVSNPGGVASGPLTIRSDDSQFTVNAGSCAQIPAAGLIDGESCEFQLTFTPTTNAVTEARVSVLSTAAGETGLAVSGRGRSPALLAATVTERDLLRANLGQVGSPQNVFTWTVRNDGDLGSGALTVENDNGADFDLSADTCSGQSIPGGSSCTVTVTFAPDTEGPRTGRITVSDPGGNSVALQVSGEGIRLRDPGEACLTTTDCAAGVCTGGVCCNQECNSTCQTCATGQCQAQTGQEPCGNGSGVCFGVNQCQLPAGTACTSNAECGGGLVCKECRFGGRQCTPPDACCGGCANPFTCVDGECGCPLQNNGLQGIDCGGGLCAVNRADACCPGSPPNGCNCDPADNLCKECVDAGDCPPGPTGTVTQCVNNSCQYPCNQQQGFRACGNTCIANNQCCTSDGCGPCEACGANNFCGPLGNQPDRCPGSQICNNNGQCVSLGSPDGVACQVESECASGFCRTWFRDLDGDGVGSVSVQVCGAQPPNGHVQASGDCCDLQGAGAQISALIRPGQTSFFAEGQTVCVGVGEYDYDCSGDEEEKWPVESGVGANICSRNLSLPECSRSVLVGGEVLENSGAVYSSEGASTCGLFGLAQVCEPNVLRTACVESRVDPVRQECR